ncbi:hypothetical protein PROVRUST_05095 [Providencia rustigianii DSM 4541]|uniref:Uncharacterized protein n=1 Tax=Providencia rustigianii DSM 4541 TaxID=500637 RepID=D1NZC3_9GAMM|nr:hypothetical protein PROVRUST_05095 [Providencia rustigianii DSM 4541]
MAIFEETAVIILIISLEYCYGIIDYGDNKNRRLLVVIPITC